MLNITIRPVLKSIRDMKGIKVPAIQDWLEDRLYDIQCAPRRTKYWFLRTFTKTKIKVPGLDGGWHDVDSKMLHVNFQLLVEFMEEEVAHMADICLGKERIPNAKTKKEKAIAYFTWEEDMSGASPDEIEHHKMQRAWETKVLNLYLWWKDTRPARKDKWDDLVSWEKETGFEPWHFEPAHANCSTMIFHENHPLWPKYKQLQDAARQHDEDCEKEDTENLKQLIELRHHLWT